MYKKSINLSNERKGPSDYTINLILNFSKSIKNIELRKYKQSIIYCN
ncbi:hypothetical protein Ga0061079_10518 [Apibacter mensalis]|uniref:Uncharacterized protein n=1 Tax=Apibacter mensalis TaxID=1586267 RepID=A0A0X3ANX9_9FLAO|nr:hypothetical protein Ga0061079_10518 [Apibacter mensalis]